MSYLEQKNYKKETVEEVQMEQKNEAYPIINGGYPTYNQCDHTTLDMTHLKHGEEWQQTLSIKLDDDRYVTVCVMKLTGNEVCLDVKMHGDEEKFKTRAVNFKQGNSSTIYDLGTLAVISEMK